MAKNKNYQNKNTVSGNKAETSVKNSEQSENSAKNRTMNSTKNTTEKESGEFGKY